MEKYRSLLQVAALPYEFKNGEIVTLLISNQKKNKWLKPKGWPIKDKSLAESASIEALEEAGVSGRISDEQIGKFNYKKRISGNQTANCRVIVFGLKITKQHDSWSEQNQRNFLRCPLSEASDRVSYPSLKQLLKKLTKNSTKLVK